MKCISWIVPIRSILKSQCGVIENDMAASFGNRVRFLVIERDGLNPRSTQRFNFIDFRHAIMVPIPPHPEFRPYRVAHIYLVIPVGVVLGEKPECTLFLRPPRLRR